MEKEGHFLGIPWGPALPPAHLEVCPAHPGLLYLGTVELQGADDFGLQPLNLQGTCGSVRNAEETTFMRSTFTPRGFTEGPHLEQQAPGLARAWLCLQWLWLCT